MNERPLDLEQLLAEQDWMLRLASGLLQDSGDAQDLAQQGTLAALEATTQPTSPRAWLATVMRRQAYRRFRTDARRTRHEQAASRAERVPSTDKMVERAETKQHVLAAVLSLKEPYRAVVLARYFEGHSPSEIAAQQGVSPNLVRVRLNRALAMLREQLQSEFGDRNWAMAVAVFLTGSTSTVTKATTGSALLWGGLIMTAKHWALCLGLIALLGGVWWFADPSVAPTVDPPGATVTASTLAVKSEKPAVFAPAKIAPPAAATVEDAPAAPLELHPIRGCVVDEDGEPVGCAVITIEGPDSGSNDDDKVWVSLVSDWKFTPPAPGSYLVSGQLTGQNGDPEPVEVVVHAGEPNTPIEIVVYWEDEDVISGRITDEEGNPVAGAQLNFSAVGRQGLAVSDSDGFYRALGVQPGNYGVIVEHPDYRQYVQNGVHSGTEGLDIVLGPRTTVLGRVVDALSGHAIQQFQVLVLPGDWGSRPIEQYKTRPTYHGAPRIEAFDNAQGLFEIDNIQSTAVTLLVESNRYSGKTVVFHELIAAPEELHVVALEPSKSIRGCVVDLSMHPIPDAYIYFGPMPAGGGTDGYAALTDEAGAFEVEPPDGFHRISAYHGDYAPAAQTRADAEEAGLWQIVLQPGHTIRGTVTSDGEPLFRAHVGLRRQSLTREYWGQSTDENGAFAFTNVAAGSLRLEAEWAREVEEGFSIRRTLRWPVTSAEEDLDLNVELRPTSATVRGRFLAASQGLAGAQVSVTVERADGVSESFGTQTDRDGEFVLATIAGDATLSASYFSDGQLRSARTNLTIVAGRDYTIDLEIGSGRASIAGTLTNVPNGYRSQIFLLAGRHSLDSVTWDAAVELLPHSIASELAGGPDFPFSFDRIPAGSYTILVATYPAQTINAHDRTVYGRNTLHTLTVTDDDPVSLQLRVP